jgi:hypothetical protein
MKLHHLIDSNSFRLYNLDVDPNETHDLASESPVQLKRMRQAYSRFVSQIDEVEPVPTEEAIVGE